MVNFSVRKDDLKWDNEGRIIYKCLVYRKEGFISENFLDVSNRKKVPKLVTRVCCQACLQTSYYKKMGYYRIKKFYREHNHVLANPIGYTFSLFLKEHKHLGHG